MRCFGPRLQRKKLLRHPKGLAGSKELDGNFRREEFHPLRHFHHSLFFRNSVAEHDPSFGYTKRDSIEYVLRTVESAVSLLEFAADNDVNLWIVDGRRGVADTELNPADPGVRIADDSDRFRPESLLKIRSERSQGCFGDRVATGLWRGFKPAVEAERTRGSDVCEVGPLRVH